jgi:hypothetical protein
MRKKNLSAKKIALIKEKNKQSKMSEVASIFAALIPVSSHK